MMKIVLLEPLGVSKEKIDSLAAPFVEAGHDFTPYYTLAADESEQLERVKNADVIIMANHPLTAEVIEKCEKLKYISVAFVGIDHIGKAACQAKGINISNAAGYCDDAVAELSVGLAMDCLRNISAVNGVIRHGGTKDGLVGHELRGRTVGIIGTGRIGRATAKLFKAFGCSLIGYSRTVRDEAESEGIHYVSLDDLLKQSDIVTVHTPLTDETKNLISREKIALMKESAILINTSRGPVVDNAALAEALSEGRLAGAGIDVFDVEPPLPEDYPLLHAKNAVCTPHIGFATVESIDRRAEIVFDNVARWMEGIVQNKML